MFSIKHTYKFTYNINFHVLFLSGGGEKNTKTFLVFEVSYFFSVCASIFKIHPVFIKNKQTEKQKSI